MPPRTAHYLSVQERREEHRETDAARRCRKRAMETDEQYQQRRQRDADAHRRRREEQRLLPTTDVVARNQHHANNLQLHNIDLIAMRSSCQQKVLECAALMGRFDRELANSSYVVYTFRVQGSFYHQIVSLLPEYGSVTTIYKFIYANIPGLDQRTHNAPTNSQVAAIWVNGNVPSGTIQKRDIILHTRMDHLIRISEFNGYIPLTFETIVIAEDSNYENENDTHNIIRHRRFASAMECYAYRLQFDLILSIYFYVQDDSFNNLLFISLQDAVLCGDYNPVDIDQRIVLPSTSI
ncbi:10175_t:CDS:2 [Ambispora leptoticha]|uniref:10175_t:CDS:1 n=1 Tax=Ambispora leptoticha TaxID=144679 RepID=A0A9N8ZYB4_9GLOM|nr:10175_t:CDS:2 [Ambispora leptoticha]